MRNFMELLVWEKSHKLTLQIYRLTADFPKNEVYGLASQMRRAAVSIPSNIAEGCGMDTRPEFARFLKYLMGSASELEYQILLSAELGYLDQLIKDDLLAGITEVKKMLYALHKSLHRR